MKAANAEPIQQAVEELNQVLQQVGAAAYQQAGPQEPEAQAGPTGEPGHPGRWSGLPEKMWSMASFTAPDQISDFIDRKSD